jgi:hypothetical protein
MRAHRLFLLAAGLCLAGSAQAATWTVGPATDCSTNSLASAVTAASLDPGGPHTIKLRNIPFSIPEIAIDDPVADLFIEGGYASCSDATPLAGARTTLTPLGAHRHFALGNDDANPRRHITLRHIVLQGGQGTGFGGGAVYATGKMDVFLYDSRIQGNEALSGGGVYLVNIDPDAADHTALYLEMNSEISGNAATHPGAGQGGGIMANGNTMVTLWDGRVSDNTAGANGGGIALISQRTQLRIEPLASEQVMVMDNRAGGDTFSTTRGYGGGIYSNSARIDSMGSSNATGFLTNLSGNRANFGGAAYIEGVPTAGAAFTFAQFENALVSANVAKGKGGAFYLRDAVDLTLDSTAREPCSVFLVLAIAKTPCSLLLLNKANNQTTPDTGGGGAIIVTNSDPAANRSIARVYRTAFVGNEDVDGITAVAHADADNALWFERTILAGNKAGADNGVLLHSAAETRLYYSTVLENDVARLFWYSGEDFNGHASILWDPGKPIWFAGPDSEFNHGGCLVAHISSGLPNGVTVLDPKIGNAWRPSPTSPAMEYCADTPHAPIADAYNLPPMHTQGIPIAYGRNELGAVEADIFFYDGFGNWPNE